MPTTTGAFDGCGISGSSSWMIATGPCAWCTSAVLTEPSSPRANAPRPRQPTTSSRASLENSTRVGTGGPLTISLVISIGCSLVASVAVSSAAARSFCPSSSCHFRYPGGMGTSGKVITTGGLRTCTSFSGARRRAASRAAQSTATLDCGDPSTPTTMRSMVAGVDILSLPLTADGYDAKRAGPTDHGALVPYRMAGRPSSQP